MFDELVIKFCKNQVKINEQNLSMIKILREEIESLNRRIKELEEKQKGAD